MSHSNIHIGKIVASHGILGDVIAEHNLGKKSTFKNVNAVFIELTKNSLIPYFIKTAKAKSTTETILLFDDITSKEKAKLLVGKKLWITKESFETLVDKKSPIALLGFNVYNNADAIGKVNEVIEQPHQILLTIIYKEKEAYIPLHENTLIKIDYRKQEIFLDLPDGLLELYAE